MVKTNIRIYTPESDNLVQTTKDNSLASNYWLEGLVEKHGDIFMQILDKVEDKIEADNQVNRDEISIFKVLAGELPSILIRNEGLLGLFRDFSPSCENYCQSKQYDNRS